VVISDDVLDAVFDDREVDVQKRLKFYDRQSA
jgi:hypothetical protein